MIKVQPRYKTGQFGLINYVSIYEDLLDGSTLFCFPINLTNVSKNLGYLFGSCQYLGYANSHVSYKMMSLIYGLENNKDDFEFS